MINELIKEVSPEKPDVERIKYYFDCIKAGSSQWVNGNLCLSYLKYITSSKYVYEQYKKSFNQLSVIIESIYHVDCRKLLRRRDFSGSN